MTDAVTLYEVGPRDGLQNEPTQIPTGDKIKLVNLLSQTGLRKIEVTSFVSKDWVPQLADAGDVLAGIARQTGITYAALTPNLKGFRAAKTAKADEVAVFAAASEGFSKANINCSMAESVGRMKAVTAAAHDTGLRVRGYISCVVDCPYDGPTPREEVAKMAAELLDMGCYQISLGDTLGRAKPDQITSMLEAVLEVVPVGRLAGHFHNTNGRALENIDASLALGLRCFDAAAGGLGGCPYAPGATGNVATEAVAAHLEAQGFDTGIDRDALANAAAFARELKGAA